MEKANADLSCTLGILFSPILLAVLLALLTIAPGCAKDTGPISGREPVPPLKEKKWVVTTLAGNGTASFVNGAVSSAGFKFPGDVAVAQDGSVYVTDVVNFCIRKISGGQVSTLAGGGGFDIVDGIGALAQFKSPYGITIGAGGNLYVTDDNDPRIRKITLAARVSTYAGSPVPGYQDGPADSARFKSGAGIAADTLGNLYIADAFNGRIRKIDAFGQVSTIAPSESFAAGGIAVDKEGNLYVADRGYYRIRKITADGTVSTVAGSGTPGMKDGSAVEAQFSADLRRIAVSRKGDLYVSDGDRIRKITSEGTVSTIAGSSAGFHDGDGAEAQFNFPNGLTVDAEGRIYVADLNNHRIRRLSFE